MLKLKKGYIDNIKEYGFILEPEHQYYFKKLGEDVEVQIQMVNTDLFEKYEIGIYSSYANYTNELELLYDLFHERFIEVITNENE